VENSPHFKLVYFPGRWYSVLIKLWLLGKFHEFARVFNSAILVKSRRFNAWKMYVSTVS